MPHRAVEGQTWIATDSDDFANEILTKGLHLPSLDMTTQFTEVQLLPPYPLANIAISGLAPWHADADASAFVKDVLALVPYRHSPSEPAPVGPAFTVVEAKWVMRAHCIKATVGCLHNRLTPTRPPIPENNGDFGATKDLEITVTYHTENKECFHCRSLTHERAFCPSAPPCKTCGNKSHHQGRCPKKARFKLPLQEDT